MARRPRGARPSVAKSVPIDRKVVPLGMGGIFRRRDELEILGFHGALAHEFLDAPTPDRPGAGACFGQSHARVRLDWEDASGQNNGHFAPFAWESA